MGFLKRTNKKFDYQPRFYKGTGSPFKIEHKLDQFRTTAGQNKGIKGFWIGFDQCSTKSDLFSLVFSSFSAHSD